MARSSDPVHQLTGSNVRDSLSPTRFETSQTTNQINVNGRASYGRPEPTKRRRSAPRGACAPSCGKPADGAGFSRFSALTLEAIIVMSIDTSSRRGSTMEENGTAKVLIAGGGVAALEACARAAGARPRIEYRVELLAPEPHFWYRPLAVAEPFELGTVKHFELGALAAEMGATFTQGELVSVDAARHVAYTSARRRRFRTRCSSIACGAVPKPAIDGAITFRGPADTGANRAAARRDRGRRGADASSSRFRSAPSGACRHTSWR